jgi:hypothetical protein
MTEGRVAARTDDLPRGMQDIAHRARVQRCEHVAM